MRYSVSIASKYNGEEGKSGDRVIALRCLAARLKEAEDIAKSSTAKLLQRNTGADAAGSVKSRVASYERNTQTELERLRKAANEEAQQLRAWLSRQSAVIDHEYNIVWNKEVTVGPFKYTVNSRRVVVYDHDLAKQNMTKLSVLNGMIRVANGQAFDTQRMVTYFSGPGHAIYVLSENGNFHAGSHNVGNRHHSSLLAGKDVAGAGELKVINGRILRLSNKSGHYHPSIFHLMQAIEMLIRGGVTYPYQVAYHAPNGQASTYDSIEAFNAANVNLLANYLGINYVEPPANTDINSLELQTSSSDYSVSA